MLYSLHHNDPVQEMLREPALTAHATGKFIRKGIGEA
jgi:hypothetical protein